MSHLSFPYTLFVFLKPYFFTRIYENIKILPVIKTGIYEQPAIIFHVYLRFA